MRLPDDYDSETLIEAVMALDWSADHPAEAMRAVQLAVRQCSGEELSEGDAMKLVGHLVDRRFIRSQIHPDVTRLVGWRPGLRLGRRAKYVWVPPDER